MFIKRENRFASHDTYSDVSMFKGCMAHPRCSILLSTNRNFGFNVVLNVLNILVSSQCRYCPVNDIYKVRHDVIDK